MVTATYTGWSIGVWRVALRGFALRLLAVFRHALVSKRKPKELGANAHKDLALGKVLWLNMLFIVVFVLCFCVFELILWLAVPAIFDKYERYSLVIDEQASWFLYSLGLSAGVLLVVFGSFVAKSLLLSRHSIDRLAKTLKAIEITPEKYKNHHKYTQLLNVIEEIAIASAMPMPRVFVMREKSKGSMQCAVASDLARAMSDSHYFSHKVRLISFRAKNSLA